MGGLQWLPVGPVVAPGYIHLAIEARGHSMGESLASAEWIDGVATLCTTHMLSSHLRDLVLQALCFWAGAMPTLIHAMFL